MTLPWDFGVKEIDFLEESDSSFNFVIYFLNFAHLKKSLLSNSMKEWIFLQNEWIKQWEYYLAN